jgi:hypothetical protein
MIGLLSACFCQAESFSGSRTFFHFHFPVAQRLLNHKKKIMKMVIKKIMRLIRKPKDTDDPFDNPFLIL